MKKRIWELDAFRGLCIIGVVLVHFVYDLVELYGLVEWDYPGWFSLIKNWGGILFILLSGVCVTLGHRPVRRGLMVVGCGMLVSAVTVGMYLLHLSDKSIIIYFGVLHCLGACMVLWALLRNLPDWALCVLGALLAGVGLYLDLGSIYPVDHPYLVPLGILCRGFISSDYFPLMPHLGFFLLGAVLGRRLYAKKESLLPKVNDRNVFIRFCSFCGRQSLWIYLGHQPVLAGICMLTAYVKRGAL